MDLFHPHNLLHKLLLTDLYVAEKEIPRNYIGLENELMFADGHGLVICQYGYPFSNQVKYLNRHRSILINYVEFDRGLTGEGVVQMKIASY